MFYSKYFQVRSDLCMLAFICAFSVVIFVYGVIAIYKHLKRKYKKKSIEKEE